MKLHQTEGLILDSRPYQDNTSILTLFSPDWGMMRLFASKRKSESPATPLTCVDILFVSAAENGLFRLREFQVRNPYLSLRQTFQALRLGGTLARILSQTQLLWKPAPMLYQLTLAYLHQALTCAHPGVYVSSFLLKLLRHEGLLGLNTFCHACGGPLNQAALVAGEVLCAAHAPSWAILFDYEELLGICKLTTSRNMGEIYNLPFHEKTKEKIYRLFDQLTEREFPLDLI